MVSEDELRQRILDAAAELFAERGYGGTKLAMVAEKAHVPARTVKRLTGGRTQLFAQVMAAKVTSEAADRLASAAAEPTAEPPLSVLLNAVSEIFAAPERSWNLLELEALTRAHQDGEVRALEADRIQRRWANTKKVTEQTRQAGGIDDAVDDDAFVHFALALSVGLAMVDPVVERQPSQANWNALMSRLGASIAPAEFALRAEHEARSPWRLRIDIPDVPGGMARLLRVLSMLHVYLVGSWVLGSDGGTRTVDLALTVPAGVTSESLLAAAMAVGSNGYVTQGADDDDVDLPTRVLDMSSELVTNPGSAALMAARLVEADQFEVTSATEGDDDSAEVLRLQWTPDQHVVLHRQWAPFARAEKTRASALLRLAAAISSAEGDADALGWVEPLRGGGTVWIRLARPEDADAVAEMHDRCSELSRYQRYFTSVNEWRGVQLRWLSGGHRGATLVVMNEEGAIIGLGNVFPDTSDEGDTDDQAAEVALIVEDAFHGRGVGSRLLRHLIELAERLGFSEVVASVLTDNPAILRLLVATGLDWHKSFHQGVVSMRAPLPVEQAGPQSPGRPLTAAARQGDEDS